MLDLNIIGSHTPLKKEEIQTVFNEAVEKYGDKKTGHINLIFVRKDEIRNLNWDFRRKNKATDVLTFIYDDKCAGEILICKDFIKENIREDLKTDMVKAFIHGILHLRGFDHEKSEKEAKSMEKKEREIFQKISIKIL
ncbi:rRNA maturation RNase YbeY [bacterium (Candidatus Howlettbacteria) CG_4_10_14_0_8_um_filter_40_9]|nr:MAG: rRNA maturation RNase YbeY [bacterium (Candidatus Howlettbacteria) CG_4_10_14_0_8_um_filter_40_9]